jgi:Flp pilus assembly pilin Flp
VAVIRVGHAICQMSAGPSHLPVAPKTPGTVNRSAAVVPIARRSAFNERGQALVEYAVIVALIGACLVAILGLVGRATRNAYDKTSSTISQHTTSAYPGGGGGGGGGLSGSVHVIPASSGEPSDSAVAAGSEDSASASHGAH